MKVKKVYIRYILAAVLAVLPLLSAAQTPDDEPTPVTVTVLTPRPAPPAGLFARVQVTDAAGEPFLGVRPQNLRVSIDGTRADIARMHTVFADSARIGAVFVVDRSASLNDEALATIRQSMEALTATFAPSDRVALVTFDSDVTVAASPITPVDQVRSEMQRVRPGDNYTALYDAVMRGTEILNAMDVTRRALYIFSDGEDTRSALDRSEVETALQDVGWPVFSVGIGQSIQPQSMNRFASITGGQYIKNPSSQDIFSLYQRLVEPLRGMEYVVYFPFTGEPMRSMHRLRIETRYRGVTYAGSILFADFLVPVASDSR